MENKPANAQIPQHTLSISYRLLFFLLSIFSIVLPISAQDANYSSSDKKAIKYFDEAKLYYDKYELENAEELLKKAIDRDPAFAEAHTLLGYVNIDAGNYDAAKINLRKAVEAKPGMFPNNLFFLAELELKDGEYQVALKDFLLFEKSINPSQQLLERSHKGKLNAEFAIKAIENPVEFKPENLGPEINTELAEYFPSLTVDGATLLFTRRLTGPDYQQGFNEDFFISEKVEGKWQKAKNLGMPINTINNEGAPSLSADGQTLIFTACEYYGNYGEDRKGFGSCDLFYTYKVGNNWDRPENLGKKINTPHWETQPSFSADGRTLFFIRGIRSRTGARMGDIYFSKLDSRGVWSLPQALPDHINTTGNEESVFIHPDGKTLYFSSDGHVGMGGLDIYVSRKNERGEWSQPENLGYPINTHKSENSLLISADGELAYFASNREQGYGDLDLYSFELPQAAKPEMVNYFTGKIYDKETKNPLMARFELIDLESGETVVESYSNSANGGFLVTLPPNRDYALNASKDGYLFYSENFSMSSKLNNEPTRKDIPLQPIRVGEKIVLRNIFFETGKYNLKESSKAELNKLVEFMQKNPKLKIEVSGHTDHVGKDADNLLLSQNRAKSVVDYLSNKGISKERLSSKGYGETQPMDSNETAEGRAANRRTEFKIVEM